MDQSFSAFDLQRMLIGDGPVSFHFEIVVRTVVIYAYTLALLRWLGSRTIGQLSTVEFLLVIALGSAVGDAMFYPDVPLLHALLVVTLVVVANKALDILIAGNKTAERVIDGEPAELISSGVISERFRQARSMGRSELFQQLRHRGIEHLGQVYAAFIEPDGAITVFRRRGSVPPGLPIVPPWEVRPPPDIDAGAPLADAMTLACTNCGTVETMQAGSVPGPCPNCSHEHWTEARKDMGVVSA